MKRTAAVMTAVALAATVASAQMKPAAPGASPLAVPGGKQVPLEAVHRMTRDDAYKHWKKGDAVFVDVRSLASFQEGHIKGALSIPGSELISRMRELPPQKLIIAYCA